MSGDVQLIIEEQVFQLDTNASGAAAEEAAASASQAGSSAQAAAASATAASGSAGTASTAAGTATAQAAAASTSAGNAHTSETNAAASASTASGAATTATNQASAASASAGTASAAATTATNQASAAAASASTASGAATTATNQATAAAASAGNAHTSEVNAKASADAAAASAGSVTGYKYRGNIPSITSGNQLPATAFGAITIYEEGADEAWTTLPNYPGDANEGGAGWLWNACSRPLTVRVPSGMVMFMYSDTPINNMSTVILHSGEWMEFIANQSNQYVVRFMNRLPGIDERGVLPGQVPLKAVQSYFATKTGVELGNGGAYTDYSDALAFNTWQNTDGGWMNLLLFSKTNVQRLYHYIAQQTDSEWSSGHPVAYADGDTFTGDYTIQKVSPIFKLNDSSGTGTAAFRIQQAGVYSWIFGTSAANNKTFNLERWVAGAYVDTPMAVSNSTGYVTFTSPSVKFSGKVSSQNQPNQLVNSSAELGNAYGWTDNGGQTQVTEFQAGSDASGMYFTNKGAFVAGTYKVLTQSFAAGANLPFNISGIIDASGVTGDNAWVEMYSVNSSGTATEILSAVPYTAPGVAQFVSATGTTLSDCVKININLVLGNSGAVAATGGLKFRKIKVEFGNAPSTYTNEPTIAYLKSGRRVAAPVAYRAAGTYSWTRNAATAYAIFKMGGGGGAGGGCPATSSSTTAAGSGGSMGGWIEFYLTAAELDSITTGAFQIVLGAGGSAQSGANGGDGGAAQFGIAGNAAVLCQCNGGPGGISTSGATSQIGSRTGGGVTLGSKGTVIVAMSGNPGGSSSISTQGAGWTAGNGGASPVGSAGLGSGGVAGIAASGNCSGGGGCVLGSSSAAIAGGAGAPAYWSVEEFT